MERVSECQINSVYHLSSFIKTKQQLHLRHHPIKIFSVLIYSPLKFMAYDWVKQP